MDIRLANIDDVSELAVVCSRTFSETYEGMGPDRPAGLIQEYAKSNFSHDILKRELMDPNIELNVAIRNGSIIGYSKLLLDRSHEQKNFVQLERLYVLKEFQGLGVGKALLKNVEDRSKAHGCSWIQLTVWEENKSAIQFYLKNGFAKKGNQDWKFSYNGFDYCDVDEVMLKLL